MLLIPRFIGLLVEVVLANERANHIIFIHRVVLVRAALILNRGLISNASILLVLLIANTVDLAVFKVDSNLIPNPYIGRRIVLILL